MRKNKKPADERNMTRRVLQDILHFEEVVNRFKDEFVEPEEENDEQKKSENLKLSKMEKRFEKIPRFWMSFRDYERRIRGAGDVLARMDDTFRDLYGTTLVFGAGYRLIFGNTIGFNENISRVLMEYNKVKDTIPGFIEKFDNEEILRIQEAYHTLIEGCYWSSVINSAVALEKRLFMILKSRNTKFMKQYRASLRFSLGELIGLYIDNKKSFHSCIPHRHDNLLTLVNDYRIISAHSKQFDLDSPTADAIFNLTLKFLIDDECHPVSRKKK
jgi:hypothetical protein